MGMFMDGECIAVRGLRFTRRRGFFMLEDLFCDQVCLPPPHFGVAFAPLGVHFDWMKVMWLGVEEAPKP